MQDVQDQEIVSAPVADTPVESPLPEAVETTDALVRRWVAGHIAIGGDLARNTGCYNELQAAIPALVSIIDEAR